MFNEKLFSCPRSHLPLESLVEWLLATNGGKKWLEKAAIWLIEARLADFSATIHTPLDQRRLQGSFLTKTGGRAPRATELVGNPT